MKRDKWRKLWDVSSDISVWFIVISIVGCVVTLAALYMSKGELFAKYFFSDALDTGMDFFHSIEYTKGRMPYKQFTTLYPPLANLFFYILQRAVPDWQSSLWSDVFEDSIYARGTSIDLRVWQSTLMMFILYIVMVAALLIVLVSKTLENARYSLAVSCALLFSYGVLYAFERGNIILLSMLCSFFFVIYRNSTNKIIAEVALIALAVAAGLKVYPAIYGALLLYDKQYKKALRAVLYGILIFFLPFLAFKEGIAGLPVFIDQLFSFDSILTSQTGVSFDQIIGTVALIVEHLGLCRIAPLFWEILPKFNIVFSEIVLILGIYQKKNWQKILCLTLAVLFLQRQGSYILVFMILPFVLFIKEEREIRKDIIVPFCAMVLMIINLPIVNKDNLMIPMKEIRFHIGEIMLFAWLIWQTVGNRISLNQNIRKMGGENN